MLGYFWSIAVGSHFLVSFGEDLGGTSVAKVLQIMARIDVLLFLEESICGSVLGAILELFRHRSVIFRVSDVPFKIRVK